MQSTLTRSTKPTAKKTASKPATGRCSLSLSINGTRYKVKPLPRDFGVISFRRAVLALDPMLRAKRRGETAPVSTLPFPTPKPVYPVTPAKVAPERKPDRPAKSSKPAPSRSVAVHDDADLASIDSELAQIDRVFEETGRRLLMLDGRKRELIKMRKGLRRAR